MTIMTCLLIKVAKRRKKTSALLGAYLCLIHTTSCQSYQRDLLSLQPKLVWESEKEKQMAIVEDTNDDRGFIFGAHLFSHTGWGTRSQKRTKNFLISKRVFGRI